MKDNIEIERKYVIMKPDIGKMREMEEYTASEILQIYLESEAGTTHRIRSRKREELTVYTETVKIRIDRLSSIEKEREITPEEFSSLSEGIRQGSLPIKKVRHTFRYNGQLFEIDFYPQWEYTAIMETELNSRTEEVVMPPFISIVREVSGEKPYSNSSMSNSFPKELITCDNASRELS